MTKRHKYPPNPVSDPFAGPSPLAETQRANALAHRRAVIDGTISGKSSALIAKEIGISAGTVRNIRSDKSVRREINKSFEEIATDVLDTVKASAVEMAEVVVAGALTGDISAEQLNAAKYALGLVVRDGADEGVSVAVGMSVPEAIERAYGIKVVVTKKGGDE